MKKFLLLILLLSTFGLTQAQNLSTSPFSRYGIGELMFQGNSRQMAMGNTGIAQYSSFYQSKLNPATLSSIKPTSVIFEFSLKQKGSYYENANTGEWSFMTNIDHISGAFRITKWWATGFGIAPFSGVGYQIIEHDSLATEDLQVNYSLNYLGSGGITQLYWSNSFSFLKHFSAGVNLSYDFGTITRENRVLIADTAFNSMLTEANYNKIRGLTYDFGFLFVDTITKNGDDLLQYSIGGIFNNNSALKTFETKSWVRITSVYNSGFSDTLMLDTLGENIINLPVTYGLGLSMTYKNKLTFSADFIQQKWSGLEILGQNNFVDTRFVGIGLEYCKNPYALSFGQRMKYRIGGYSYENYIALNNEQLKTQAVTFGVGMVFKNLELDLNVSSGIRGSSQIGLTEKFVQMNFGIILYDNWFIKRKFM